MLGMMCSSTDEWRKERLWMLRFIRDGFKGLQDWKLLRRRHVLELLTSQFEAGEDLQARGLILEVSNQSGTLADLGCYLLLFVDHPQSRPDSDSNNHPHRAALLADMDGDADREGKT